MVVIPLWLAGFIAGAVLIGWFTGNPWAAELVRGLAPMPINAAIGILATSSAMLFVHANRSLWGFLFASVAALLSILTCYEWITGISLGIDSFWPVAPIVNDNAPVTGRMSPITATCLLLVNLPVMAYLGIKGVRERPVVLAFCGFLASGASLVGLATNVAHLNLSASWLKVNQMSPHTAFCIFLIGIATVSLSHGRKSLQDQGLKWLAVSATLCALFATLMFWQAELAQDRHHIRITTAKATQALEESLKSRISQASQALSRFAARMESGIQQDELHWRADAKNCVKDFPEFKAIEWIDKSLRVVRVEPSVGNEAVLNSNVTFDGRSRPFFQTLMDGGGAMMSKSIVLPQGSRGFAIYVPVKRNGRLEGVLSAVCAMDAIAAQIPISFKDSHYYEIWDGYHVIYSNCPKLDSNPFRVESTMRMLGVPWRLKVAPVTEEVSKLQSSLPQLILVCGIVLSFIAGLVVILVDSSLNAARKEQKARKFLEGLSETSANLTYVFEFGTGSVIYCNRYAIEMMGYTLEEIQAGGAELQRKLIHPDDQSSLLSRRSGTFENGQIHEFKNRLLSATGEWRWILHRQCVLTRDAQGHPLQIMGTGQDITDLLQIQEALYESKALLEKIVEQAPIGKSIVSLEGKWLQVNPALCEFLGYTEQELLTMDFQILTHPDDLEKDMALVRQVLDGEIQTYRMEKRYFHKNRSIVWVQLDVSLLREADGKPQFFISQIQDITERKRDEKMLADTSQLLEMQKVELIQMNQRLEQSATTDPLTGLANRRAFTERLEVLLSLQDRYPMPVSVIMLDVDHFKDINDQFGHITGDDVLAQIAKCLTEEARDSDLVARYGGEEFVVLCPQTSEENAVKLAERIRARIEAYPFQHGRVTASLGVSERIPTHKFSHELLASADIALYLSKGNGRNRVSTVASKSAA